MLDLNDVSVLEGEVDVDAEGYYAAVQNAINAGSWGFQGSYGRVMMDAIKSGHCMLGKVAACDYYGNPIPSRYQVLEGSKGSRDFVADAMGEDWAAVMEAL